MRNTLPRNVVGGSAELSCLRASVAPLPMTSSLQISRYAAIALVYTRLPRDFSRNTDHRGVLEVPRGGRGPVQSAADVDVAGLSFNSHTRLLT